LEPLALAGRLAASAKVVFRSSQDASSAGTTEIAAPFFTGGEIDKEKA
jgi:hypothetical protein